MSERPILFSAPIDRFMRFVSPEPNTGCWLWTGSVNEKGYGRFDDSTAHRWAHRIFKGEVDSGQTVDHLCRQRCCVNPAHLEAVAHRLNIARGVSARDRGVCPKGHPRAVGSKCRECDRVRNLAAYKKTTNRRRYRWLSNEAKWRIRTLIAHGLSHSEIAALVGVSIATISRVRNSDD